MKAEIKERLDILTPKLYDLGNRMYSKWGTESYEERCINSDIRDELTKVIALLDSQPKPMKELTDEEIEEEEYHEIHDDINEARRTGEIE